MGNYSGGKRVRLVGNPGDSTNSGFAVLGYSGCGKSSSIKMLTDNYPQTILHNVESVQFPQIVYLVVSCAPNSKFSTLYISIGKAIDKALNMDVHAKVFEKNKNLGVKQSKLEEFIEIYNIGIIIFDEIQLLDFSSTKESTFETLMVIANNTKVAMAVVGTEDGFEKMFKNIRTARRLGISIAASKYCNNYNFYKILLNDIWPYQWFDKHVDLNDEIAKAFYQETKGIIDFTINIYTTLQNEYLISKIKPVVDANYVHKIAEKHYPSLRILLDDLNNPEARKEIDKMFDIVNSQFEKDISQRKQDEIMNDVIEENMKLLNSKTIERAITSIYDTTDGFEYDAIESAVREVALEFKEEKLQSKLLVKKAFSQLRSKSKKKKTKPKINHQEMFSEIINQ